jgi:Domain of unknown function (DUF4383)
MRDRTPVQSVASLVGAVFVLVGVLGFVPGVTDHVHNLSFAGHDSGAKLLGLFQVSILHNLVHLSFGLVGIAIAKTMAGARNFLVGGGAVYLALWVLGVAGGGDWIPTNTADNMLHFGLGIGMIGLGFVTSRFVTSRAESLRPSCVP